LRESGLFVGIVRSITETQDYIVKIIEEFWITAYSDGQESRLTVILGICQVKQYRGGAYLLPFLSDRAVMAP